MPVFLPNVDRDLLDPRDLVLRSADHSVVRVFHLGCHLPVRTRPAVCDSDLAGCSAGSVYQSARRVALAPAGFGSQAGDLVAVVLAGFAYQTVGIVALDPACADPVDRDCLGLPWKSFL